MHTLSSDRPQSSELSPNISYTAVCQQSINYRTAMHECTRSHLAHLKLESEPPLPTDRMTRGERRKGGGCLYRKVDS